MSDEDFQEYFKTRFQALLAFYDKRSMSNKRWHRGCALYILTVSSVLVPLISTGSFLADHKLLGGLLSATIVAVTAAASHFQFNDNWLSYRATWDALQREPHLRMAKLREYASTTDRNSLFVDRVESLASSEGREWLGRHSIKAKEDREGRQAGKA
jgi:hypothetical protein